MTVESVPVGSIRPYEGNPRVIPESAVSAVAASIRRFGFRQPVVVDSENVIVAGQTRLLAAKSLGLDSVPVHRASDLSDEDARLYRLADNRTSQESSWDMDALAAEARDIAGADGDASAMDGAGFDLDEINGLLAMTAQPPEPSPTGRPKIDTSLPEGGLTAPFPWYGGKRRWARTVLERFDGAERYLEPFAGSLAVLLARPEPFRYEIVSDTSGLICNFWRAIKHSPEETAEAATWPTIHQDLSARNAALTKWNEAFAPRLSEDPEYHDAKMAGWWAWGVSNSIGAGYGTKPRTCSHRGGQGLQMQRTKGFRSMPTADRCFMDPRGAGQGVQAQRRTLPGGAGSNDSQGHATRSIAVVFPHSGGEGVQVQSSRFESESIQRWFAMISARLEKVVVLNRDWKICKSRSVLANTSTQRTDTCIFLDPPYRLRLRSNGIYESDREQQPDRAAIESYRWAAENGSKHRIAYCCHDGDFPVPSGWDCLTMSFGGSSKNETRDMIMFSPRCNPPPP